MGGLKKCDTEAQNKKRPGRPAKEIDWKMVDEFLVCGSPGTEIASLFDMHHETFYIKFREYHKMGFTAYCQEKRFKGEALLRRQQFLKAIGKSTDGDNTMLVWLGKNRLGQSDSPTQDAQEEVKAQFSEIMAQLTKRQEDAQSSKPSLSIDENINNSDA